MGFFFFGLILINIIYKNKSLILFIFVFSMIKINLCFLRYYIYKIVIFLKLIVQENWIFNYFKGNYYKKVLWVIIKEVKRLFQYFRWYLIFKMNNFFLKVMFFSKYKRKVIIILQVVFFLFLQWLFRDLIFCILGLVGGKLVV